MDLKPFLICLVRSFVVTSICTNCAILVWLYDHEGKWNIEPGIAAILVMEHILLLIKFGFSRLVPEVILNHSCEHLLTSLIAFRVCNCWNISGYRAAGTSAWLRRKNEVGGGTFW